MKATVLDPCCGGRMMWFNRQDQRALFGDIRSENHTLCDGRAFNITPDPNVAVCLAIGCPPLPVVTSLPFQPSCGTHSSKLTRESLVGRACPLTRQKAERLAIGVLPLVRQK